MKRTIKEKIILNRLKKQDIEAFTETYDLYVDKLYRFVYFKVGEVEMAQDLTSEVFLRTWNYVCENKEVNVKTLPALLYRVARNVVIDHYRANKHNVSIDQVNEDGELKLDIEATGDDPIDKLDIDLTMDKVQTALAQLKDEYREIIVMRYIDELTIEEIADILEKNKGNIRVLAYRALQALKAILGVDN
ncbi:MAG: RNA polymerase sigma factor [bacterium]